jgi:hypothetical protein
MADKLTLLQGDKTAHYFWEYFTEKLPGMGNQIVYYVLSENPKSTQVVCRRTPKERGSFSESAARDFLVEKLHLGEAHHFFAKLSPDGQSILCRRADFS